MVKDKRIVDPKKVISNITDPEGWTVENNPHPYPACMRVYPDSDGEYWTDYFEYFGNGKHICHNCLRRAKIGSGNCQDGGQYFICVSSGKREKLRKEYAKKEIQTKLI